ncbi:hypothetical protein F8A87_10625 [Betaproteobacteria bacterium SCN2]|jgi:hypothetical protein|nr:hypothetical protein F8A87_10625 [Betaproteobacteria bacterium SCN2]
MSNYIVYLGAVGWTHAAWESCFYPDGLPADWQLSFYNTQFRCTYLPMAHWRNASDEEVAGWLQEPQQGFRFVLGGAGEWSADDVPKAARFGNRAVREADADICWLEGEPDLRELARRMQAAARTGVPLYVISRDAALAALGKVRELMDVLGV